MIRADYAKWLARGHEHEQAGRPIDAYLRILAGNPEHVGARMGVALSRVAQGDEAAYADLSTVLGNGAAYRR